VVDALKVVDTDEVSLEMQAPNRPGLLKAGADFLYVIMPVNLQ
jgi:DNA polymerase III sliding clamp (beta) subunit (PCNA family)